MIERISERVFKNWKTTVIAVLTGGLITYLGLSNSVEWETLYGWYAAAFTFLFNKDS